jgi:hypothetical protein
MTVRIRPVCYLALALVVAAPGHGAAQGYPGYPYTIMAPEPGTALHHRPRAAVHKQEVKAPEPRSLATKKYPPQRFSVVRRGSSGSVLPTPLPRTELIPPEGNSRLTLPAVPQEQGPSIVPGVANPVPNLPHGSESFQDRASRCAFQSGLYNVPGTAKSQYMGACVQ